MITKLLVANRGEIAIPRPRLPRRLRTRYSDRGGGLLKAAESYQIGEPGHPVRAYLTVAEIIATARAAGADAIISGTGSSPKTPIWQQDARLPASSSSARHRMSWS